MGLILSLPRLVSLMTDSFAQYRTVKGKRIYWGESKLTAAQRRRIKSYTSGPLSLRAIGRLYDIHYSTVRNIRDGVGSYGNI